MRSKKFVFDTFRIGSKTMRLERSRISFLMQIHQLAKLHARFKARKKGVIVAQLSDTVSVSADSGYLWGKGKK